MSPRQPSPAQRSVSPYKWVRQDFENPNSDVETCKRRLLFKLDDLARGGETIVLVSGDLRRLKMTIMHQRCVIVIYIM